MIADPRTGDIVYLDPDNPAGWIGFLPFGERFQIVSITPELNYRNEPRKACRLRSMKTGEMMTKGNTTHGTHATYLIRDEFLSAAYHAKEENAA